MEGLGQGEGADLLHARHRQQPALLLLVRAEDVDRPHGEARVDAEGGGEAAVAAGHLHRDHARSQGGHGGAAVALDDATRDVEVRQPVEEVVRELRGVPGLVHDRLRVLHESADPVAGLALARREVLLEAEEIGALRFVQGGGVNHKVKVPGGS
jgi:hypothetical protein